MTELAHATNASREISWCKYTVHDVERPTGRCTFRSSMLMPHRTITAPLLAVVKDAAGNPIPGITVTYAAPASGASATLSNGTSSGAPITTTTDASGMSSVIQPLTPP